MKRAVTQSIREAAVKIFHIAAFELPAEFRIIAGEVTQLLFLILQLSQPGLHHGGRGTGKGLEARGHLVRLQIF